MTTNSSVCPPASSANRTSASSARARASRVRDSESNGGLPQVFGGFGGAPPAAQ